MDRFTDHDRPGSGESPPWPELPAELGDLTSKEALAAWERYLHDARQASWHGPFPVMPDIEMVVRHGAARKVLSDEARFAPHLIGAFRAIASLNPHVGSDLDALLEEMQLSSLIDQVGGRHRSLRALLSPAFSPRSVNRIRPFVRDLAAGLLADLQPGDDFMAGFARQVPPRTLCEVIGVPEADRDRCAGWMAALAPLLSPLTLLALDTEQATVVVEARRALVDYCVDLIGTRRADPGDDLASHVAHAGQPALDDRALAVNLADLLSGGNDSTQRALGQMTLTLIERPDLWDAVQRDPALAETVVEECLRHQPPVPGPFRRTAGTTREGDTSFDEGQVLWVSSLSANHDETVFDDASTFDPHRSNARYHVSFGYGTHQCIGANLARAVLQECLQILTATITPPQVCGEVVITNQGAAGPAVLPITFERR